LTLGATLGAGAFKESYLAADADAAQFALKIVRASANPDRIAREVAAMKRCKHPNIAVLHASGLDHAGGQTYCWLLEEYLAGGSLGQKLEKVHPLSIGEVKRIGAAIIGALAYLRPMSLVHRDIKPDNIMFRADGTTPVLVDFGLVRDLGDESLTQTELDRGPGTPFFAAPEQLHNRKELIDWRTDQFSLGVVMAVCGFGRHPYADAADAPARVVFKVREHGKVSPDFVTWAQANDLAALIRMTNIWPVQRYRTPAQLQQSWA
jgi:serine/threonine protein kinase